MPAKCATLTHTLNPLPVGSPQARTHFRLPFDMELVNEHGDTPLATASPTP